MTITIGTWTQFTYSLQLSLFQAVSFRENNMDAKNENTNPFDVISTNPFDTLNENYSTSLNPFDNLPENLDRNASSAPPDDLPPEYKPEIPQLPMETTSMLPPDDLPPSLNDYTADTLMENFKRADIIPDITMDLISPRQIELTDETGNLQMVPYVDMQNLPILIEGKKQVQSYSDKLLNIAFHLKPSHSLWESMTHQYKNSGITGKIVGGSVPMLIPGVGYGAKLAGILAVPSMSLGLGFGLALACWGTMYLLSNSAANNSNINPLYQTQLTELGEAINLVFDQLRNLCEQFAFENQLYKNELNILHGNNMKLTMINNATEMELKFLGVMRREMETQLASFKNTIGDLQTNLDNEKALHQKSHQELELQIKQRKEQIQIFELKNKEYQSLLQDMQLQNETSNKMITQLKGTIQKLAQTQIQHLNDEAALSQKLQKIFDESGQRMNQILTDMSEKNNEYRENLELFKNNTQKMSRILEQEEALSAQIDRIMPAAIAKPNPGIAALVSHGFLGKRPTMETSPALPEQDSVFAAGMS